MGANETGLVQDMWFFRLNSLTGVLTPLSGCCLGSIDLPKTGRVLVHAGVQAQSSC